MIENADSLIKFALGCATVLGSILGSAALIRPKEKAEEPEPAKRPTPSPPGLSMDAFEEKFRQGERRMATIEEHQKEQDRKSEDDRKEVMAIKLEMAELRPTFQGFKDAVGSLRGYVESVEETLAKILRNLPDK